MAHENYVTPGYLGQLEPYLGEKRRARREMQAWIHRRAAGISIDENNHKRGEKKQQWWEVWGREQQRLAALAMTNEVVYVEANKEIA